MFYSLLGLIHPIYTLHDQKVFNKLVNGYVGNDSAEVTTDKTLSHYHNLTILLHSHPSLNTTIHQCFQSCKLHLMFRSPSS